MSWILVVVGALGACVVGQSDDDENGGGESGDGDGDPGDGDGDGEPGDGDGEAGDGDGEPGDGDGEPGDGDGEPGDGDGEPGDGDGEPQGCVDDSGDGDYPGLCSCEPEGAPCYKGCVEWEPALTCDAVCAARGEACVENGCWNATAIGGNPNCPGPSEYGGTVDVACNEPLPEPFLEGGIYDCCCQ